MRTVPSGSVEDLEQAFVASLPLIDRIVSIQARQNGLTKADAEDFASWAKARLIERDYAILRAFAGRSSLATYLSVVLHNLLRDYRNAHWGRWRPSAIATRAGPVAVRLEELLRRDGYTLREASQLLQAAGVCLSDGEIARLAARLPQRMPNDEVSLESLGDDSEQLQAHAAMAPEAVDASRAIERTVQDVIATLSAEDALILRMRFWSDMSVADIARALRLEQKPLYRRLDAVRARLRAELEARGIDQAVAAESLNAEL